MRILICVFYFLTLFYGVELLFDDDSNETAPTDYVANYEYPKVLKESIEDSTACAYYATYKMCTDLHSKQITYSFLDENDQ
ncbi:hypothetical protein ACIQZG_15570 [Lysinibacillus sp. NPDC096418]|uniref:hypothetical protein n=1 Tax=Lysinibacillus sp. NPDC096418 TaxID=3364138 RepID=UPI003800CFBB